MSLVDRFIRYAKFDTQSSEDSTMVPSTPKQLIFARYLRDEMIAEGLHDVVLSNEGYLYATLPSNLEDGASVPTIGFISHYDTSPDCSGCGVKPRIVEHYDGDDITLSKGIVSSPEKFPELLQHVGEDLIVTDGHTLLGADDKAGIAEIMQAVCYLRDHPELKHGDIRIAFNPDEEIGMGAHHFDVSLFGCQWAYTIDGGDLGELEYENFNAASAKVTVTGISVHPGYAKGKMLNASLIAHEFISLLPADERPETTDGYQGFYHLTSMEGCCEKAQLSFIIRDHDHTRFSERKEFLRQVAQRLNQRYGEGVCQVVIADQYYNMLEKIQPVSHIIERAKQAMLKAGVTPKVQPIRGGTDGAQLSFRGLPCPNLFTGAVNFHGPYEFISVQVMEKATKTIIHLCQTSPL